MKDDGDHSDDSSKEPSDHQSPETSGRSRWDEASPNTTIKGKPDGDVRTKSRSPPAVKKRSKKRKREKSLLRSSESEQSSSEEGSQSGGEQTDPIEPSIKFARFTVASNKSQKDWKLPSEMKKYARKNFNSHISDKELEESILDDNPVPSNFMVPRALDVFFKEFLEEGGKHGVVQNDKSLMKSQQHIINIMGPLGKLWNYIEEVKNDEIHQ